MSDLLNTLIHDARIWQGRHHIQGRQPAHRTGHATLDRQLGDAGWPVGALSECLVDAPGIGELQLVLPLVRQLADSGKAVFWINPPCIPYAPALARAGIALDQIVVIHTKAAGDTLWTLENCLRSAATGLVLAWPGSLANREIRRLQLAAEAGSNVCVLFRPRRQAHQGSPAALRLELEAANNQGLQVRVLKHRGSWPGEPCQVDVAGRTGDRDRPTPTVITGPWTGSGT